MIEAKIDVTKITKEKLYVGAKGTYLNVRLIETPEGKYGDWMVVEATTKEEYEAGVKGVILGNGKNFKKKTEDRPKPETTESYEDLPF